MVSERKVYIWILFGIFLLFGIGWIPWWNTKPLFQLFVPNREDQFAREYIELLRQGDYTAAEKLLSPDLAGSESFYKLKQVSGFINREDLVAVEVIATNVLSGEKGKHHSLTYQLLFTESFVIANVVVERAGDRLAIAGIHVEPIPRPIQELTAFTLAGKPFVNFFILACAVLIPFLILATLFLCVRSDVRFKWLWIIFILFGICQLRLDWTTNEIQFELLSVQLFGASFVRPGLYGPWNFFISIPLGAKVFLAVYFKKTRKGKPSSASGDPEENVEGQEAP